MRGRRTILGGRARVRTRLYMAALSATKHNPVIKAYYNHLLKLGKAKESGFNCVHEETADYT